MNSLDLKKLKLELAINAKSGIDFILSAAIIWSIIAFVWTLRQEPFTKSIWTFYVGMIMLPLAFLFSKLLKTNWTTKTNPLQPLGMWLNVAQLFYFPFLFFVLRDNPDYFVMTYVIITGAHFFPYAWFYDEIGYAIAAGVISVGALLIAINVPTNQMYFVPLFMVGCLLVLAIRLLVSNKRERRQPNNLPIL
ncbi:hypothetical protein NYZ99_10540 [Maribacter litopenaei]|uniref:Uncharacterized protein n=1 Tax=Maribacter litopenaei TaxID=2976127 RepID=A0ABY5Y6L7_9FLAO|nr:hypothetical protein [Maribacter litopenaei]UWX53626.1 hypothetical protein NYZ99_10540 [Maribacter litopenaei]